MTHMRRLSSVLLLVVGLLVGVPAVANAQAYNPITPTKADQTISVTGKDMTVQDVVDIARHGAKVEVSRQHRRSTAANLQLVLEGARQGVPIYGFNRGGGAERELVIFEGDPLSEENAELLVQRRYDGFRFVGVHGGGEQHSGLGPEVADEEIVRAQMAVTLNRMRYAGMNPALVDLLVEFLNKRITPVVLSRGTDGGGDLSQDGSVRAAMVGVGDVYLQGQRMSARQALTTAGVTPLQKTVDSIGVYAGWGGHNSYTDGQAALLVHDAKHVIDWGDLVFAMSMLGLNSSIAPITAVPQNARQFPYVNWQAKRLLNILRGSYLFNLETDPNDPQNTHGQRLLQDPLSYRDYSQRNGPVWEAYVRLKKNLLIQINSNSSNPVIMPGVHPDDSWELDTPWVKRYYIEPADDTEGGFVLGSANFDNTPLNNNMEQFTLALAQSYVGTLERTQRTFDPFFTVVRTTGARGLLEGFPESVQCNVPHADAFAMSDILGELKSLANPVPAEGNWTERGIQDVQGLGRQKVAKARLAVDNGLYLLSQELLSATKWMDHRRVQSPVRSFGAAPTAAWQAWRVLSPCQQDPEERDLMETWRINLSYAFLKGNPAAKFLGADAAEPTAAQVRYRTNRAMKKARQHRKTLRRHATEPVARARAAASRGG
jgi:histidine ammonia-lyase